MTYADVAFLIAQLALIALAYWFGYRHGGQAKQAEYKWLLESFQRMQNAEQNKLMEPYTKVRSYETGK